MIWSQSSMEKIPETINVIFPVVEGVIADYNLLQTMIFDFLEHKTKARIKNAEFIIAVPTDITDVEKRAFYELFYKSKSKPKKVMLCVSAHIYYHDTGWLVYIYSKTYSISDRLLTEHDLFRL